MQLRTRRGVKQQQRAAMEMIIWTAVTFAAFLLVWALAPYHQQIIDNRPAPAPDENWD